MVEPQILETDRGFRVAHQKVSIDVDLANWAVCGWTELTIVPTDGALKSIRLDARQMRIHNVHVNGRKAAFTHTDPLIPLSQIGEQTGSSSRYTPHKKRIQNLLCDTIAGELVIPVPKGIKITPQDAGSASAASLASMSRSAADVVLHNPLSVKVEFSTHGSTSGFRFVGGRQSNLKDTFWHAYTTHNPIGQATSSWLPCVDGLWELCTWELEISVPRTVGELVKKDLVEAGDTLNGESGSADASGDEDEEQDIDEEDERDIVVVCNNASPQEKVVTFDLFTAVSAHHIGFAVGPFVHTAISDLRRNDEEYEAAQDPENSTPISVYTLPDKAIYTANSCVFLYRAMEYFSREFGSYPFSAFCVCFVGEAEVDVSPAACLAITSEKLLFGPDMIEPLFTTTEALSVALASQWCGVNIVPKTWDDMWITIGIARLMSDLFLRKLMGNNEFRFKLKKQAEEICRQDISKPPLANPKFLLPIRDRDLEFIKVKAPVVLFILDKRMTKTDRSLGLSRVLPKLFLQAMSGDLNSCLSTSHFIRLCERVGHNRLESFFDQWVFGSGYPIFRVTQRFNKKRMIVEMGIRQMQNTELPSRPLNPRTFVDEVNQSIQEDEFKAPPVFTGPMTIRIHEADGTPYEHVVDLKENFTKLDIQYNTKYKRLKRRNQRRGPAIPASASASLNGGAGTPGGPGGDLDLNALDGEDGGVLLHCLGDVLQSDRSMREWRLRDWNKDEEEHMVNEAFEWIRVDSDFEWICKIYVNQPDYMYVSQLQQDRDVDAQYDAVRFFAGSKPSALYSTILVRTLMDSRYYYGIRVAAAFGLARMAVAETEYIGMFHLQKAFQTLFCFEGSLIPVANNFADFPTYFVQKALPLAMANIRDSMGNCPMEVKKFLLDLLRYNDNSSNDFSDCYYVCQLIEAIARSVQASDETAVATMSISSLFSKENRAFAQKAVAQIDRCQRMDRWIPSHYNMITTCALNYKRRLVQRGYLSEVPRLQEAIQYSNVGNSPDVRLAAFHNLLSLGGIHNEEMIRYFFFAMNHDLCPYVRDGLVQILAEVIGEVALYEDFKPLTVSRAISENKKKDDPLLLDSQASATTTADGSSSDMIIEETNQDSIASRKEQLARTTLKGASQLVRKSLETFEPLKNAILDSVADGWLRDICDKRILLEICQVLYPEKDSVMVTLPMPRAKRLVAQVRDGSTMVVVKRVDYAAPGAGKLKTNINGNGRELKKPRLSLGARASEETSSTGAERKSEQPAPIKQNIKLKLKLT